MGFIYRILGINVLKLLFTNISWIKVLTFIKKYWKIILIAIFIFSLIWKHYNLIRENEELKNNKAVLSTVLQTYKDTQKDLTRRIEDQNKEIDKFVEQGEERKKVFSEALTIARKTIEERDKEINKLLQINPKNETCEASIEWLLNIKEKLKW